MNDKDPTPDPSSEEREEALFQEALQHDGADARAAFLERACSDDADLRRRVESLLHAHFQARTFLEEPAAPPRRPTLRVELKTAPVLEQSGQRIGPYKLLQQLGEGGCGVVFMAEQLEPVRRRVALKVIKLGMDTRQVVARFEAERQALALMDHPNIARVLDAGATESGRPYFVMELVRGLPITRFADEHNLSTGERLQLFIQVCRALQHAHQKGIIHRDLKPTNILVTLHDGVPVPKVIDFGIAKVTNQQPLTDKTLFTAFEQFLGTPAYMSPEQTELSGLDIDTRSDIYSLGVLLYELLTGRTPFDARDLIEAGFEEMRRTIREREPAKPSTRLTGLLESELTTVAKTRRTEAAKLVSRVRGDLDWVVMKCLDKDRMRRYETAGALAEDIQRHLSSEPVQARSPGVWYRSGKFVRRNRVPVGLGAIVVFVLIAAMVTHGFSYFRLKEARALAEQRLETATLERQRAEEAVERETAQRRLAERNALLAQLTLMAGGAQNDQLMAPHLRGQMREQYFQRRLDHWTNAVSEARSALHAHGGDDEIRMLALQILGAHAQALFNAGATREAGEAAREWLSKNTDTDAWYFGNVIHDANLLLGRIALSGSSTDQAGAFLLRSADTPGSPQLNSFGPNLILARELVEAGQSEIVLRYLDRIAEFWGHPYPENGEEPSEGRNAEVIERWKAAIADGRIPDHPKWLDLESLP